MQRIVQEMHQYSTRVIVLLFILFTLSVAGQENQHKEKIEEGYHLANKRQLDDALHLFNNMIETNQDIAEVYIGRAYVRQMQFEFDEALQDIYRGLSLKSQFPQAYYVRGLIEIKQGGYQRALADFDKALEIQADFQPAIAGKIMTYFQSDELRKAENLANDALKKFPEYGDLHFHLGKIHSKKNRYEKAIESFTKALELNNEVYQFETLLNRGDARQNLNMLEEALQDFNRALLIDKKEPSVYHGRGVVYYKLNRYKEAIADFNHSIRIIEQHKERYEDNSETYYNLGMSHLRTEERGRACKHFHKGCQLGNQNACRMIILRCSQN